MKYITTAMLGKMGFCSEGIEWFRKVFGERALINSKNYDKAEDAELPIATLTSNLPFKAIDQVNAVSMSKTMREKALRGLRRVLGKNWKEYSECGHQWDIDGTIIEAFKWEETEEGWEFWSSIHWEFWNSIHTASHEKAQWLKPMAGVDAKTIKRRA